MTRVSKGDWPAPMLPWKPLDHEPEGFGDATERVKRTRMAEPLYALAKRLLSTDGTQARYVQGLAIAIEKDNPKVARDFFGKLSNKTKGELPVNVIDRMEGRARVSTLVPLVSELRSLLSKPGLTEFRGKPAKVAVTKYFTDKMPKPLRKLMAAALDDLYQGPNVGTGFSYTKAIKELSSWWGDEGSEVWYDGESGEVLDSEPQGYEDEETGEYVEPEMSDYTHFSRRDAAQAVFGALVTDGGMSI